MIPYWQDEDGGGFVPVEEADEATAGQYLADDWGLLVIASGRGRFTLRDCECYPAKDSCPDDDDGKPCVVRERVDGWSFESYDPDMRGWHDATDWRTPDDKVRAWWPKGKVPADVAALIAPDGPTPIPVAPGQVEAGL